MQKREVSQAVKSRGVVSQVEEKGTEKGETGDGREREVGDREGSEETREPKRESETGNK
jgi:hypothetical protein